MKSSERKQDELLQLELQQGQLLPTNDRVMIVQIHNVIEY